MIPKQTFEFFFIYYFFKLHFIDNDDRKNKSKKKKRKKSIKDSCENFSCPVFRLYFLDRDRLVENVFTRWR